MDGNIHEYPRRSHHFDLVFYFLKIYIGFPTIPKNPYTMPCMPSAAVLLLVVLAFASPTPNRAKVPHTWQEHGQLTDLDVLRNSPAVDDDLLRRVRETKPSFEVGFNKM